MFDHDRAAVSARIRRRVGAALGLAAVSATLLAAAGTAGAASHDYCNWDGSYNGTPAFSICFQAGDNWLTNNHAWLPYLPGAPTIYCGARAGGVDYGGWSGGNPSCNHPYGGGTLLKAGEFVNTAATTHGTITY